MVLQAVAGNRFKGLSVLNALESETTYSFRTVYNGYLSFLEHTYLIYKCDLLLSPFSTQ